MKPERDSKEVKRLKKTSMNVPPATWQQFRIETLKEGRTAQEVLTELIEQYLKKKGGESRGKR